MKAASLMTLAELDAEIKKTGDEFDEIRRLASEDDGGGGGSPGEWAYERLSELETARRRLLRSFCK